MATKILIIDKSEFVRNYLMSVLEDHNFEVILARDGLDGYLKMRNQIPDLIIMDFSIQRMNSVDFLDKKFEFKGTREIPIIITFSKVNKEAVYKLSKYNIHKITQKPVDMDVLFGTIGELFKIDIKVKTYPCIIDIYNTNEMLNIKISKGLDTKKIKKIDNKINELSVKENIQFKKLLIIFDEIANQKNFEHQLKIFLDLVMDSTELDTKDICILSNINIINNFLNFQDKYKNIKIVNTFDEGAEYLLLGKEAQIISKNNNQQYNIAIIDDDNLILEYMETILNKPEWALKSYDNGRSFINDLADIKFDLIFLDLMMPDFNGFDILEYLNDAKINIPVIVLSALNDRDSVMKVKNNNVKNFIVKPGSAKMIVNKADEILSQKVS